MKFKKEDIEIDFNFEGIDKNGFIREQRKENSENLHELQT